MKTSYDALWLAVGHIRAAKTKIFSARVDFTPLDSATDDLLRAEARELYKIEQRLIARSKAIQATADAPRAETTKPSKPRRSAPRRAA